MSGAGRVIAFDLGARRIGFAVSDPSRLLAERGGHLTRSGDSYPWKEILRVVQDEEATQVVVGDPLSMSGRAGDASLAAREFANELARRTGLSCDMEDERLTSVEAMRIMKLKRKPRARIPTKKKREEHRSQIDRIAALLILQAWLDRQPRTPLKHS